MSSKTNEQAFEALIERALVGSTREEREAVGMTDVDAQQPDAGKYYWGQPKDLDKKLALDLRRLWLFLEATQADELAKHKGSKDVRKAVQEELSRQITAKGVIDVLRKKLEVDNIELTLFYPKPSAADSELSHQKWASNQFSLTRQATFSQTNPGLELDLLLAVNGIPLFTFELKNPWTHQTARYDGQKQYCSAERDPKETLLQFGRCLAHFAVDKNEIFFTTRLAREKTYFMPFNKGLPDGQGAGNPVNEDGGYKTAYLWEQVLQPDMLADIIQNYVLFDYGEAKTQKKVPHVMKNAKRLIFPRYHQLDVVNCLVADVARCGIGKRYLIEHSAGSGKSNSLTWLAFKLIKTCADTMDAVRARSLDSPIVDTVVVVTDRRLLDRQITDNIGAFAHSKKIFAHADTSKELKEAIEQGKRIVITTIQKFPYICHSINDVSDKNFAIVIDEAHSSQSGIAADAVNIAMEKAEGYGHGELDTDELIAKLIEDRKMSSNCSYFAFTATPKRETLERFGVQDAEGKFHPFHLYSMKQAIEEGFILDVLKNYTTYKSYYELAKSIEENPEFDKTKAQKLLRKVVERHPRTIAEKAETMLGHFDANVFRTHKLKGKAKALVVTKDIECAIRYFFALRKLMEDAKIPYKILIAFSGEKTVDGINYTEAGINGFSETETAERFNSDEYRLLVVANKYLTGFDQPKLTAMYIDKPLAGVLAVQALSRLNRSAPDLNKMSDDLFVLDFFNTVDQIKDAFDPFYTATTLAAPTDVNVLHDLRNTLLEAGVMDEEEIEEFMELYISGVEADQWAHLIDAAVHRFEHEIEWEEEDRIDFKMKAKQFTRIYSRVAAILDYSMPKWEKLFWYLHFLIPELTVKIPGRDNLNELIEAVNLNTYGLRRTSLNTPIGLDSGEAVIDPLKPTMVNAGAQDEEDELDNIIKEFNERWFKGWEATPEDQKTKLVSIAKAVIADADYQDLILGNPDKDAVEQIMTQIIDRVVRQKRKSDNSLYRQYQQNEAFKTNFRTLITRMIETA